MDENELKQILSDMSEKIDMVYASVEKTRKYFLAVLIVSLVLFILPLIGLVFAIPSFLSGYNALSGL